MKITFDPAKNARNIAERGLPFERVAEGDWSTAFIWEDTRFSYGEPRFCALLSVNGRLHSVVFTPRDGATHVISFRKSNKREERKYETGKSNR